MDDNNREQSIDLGSVSFEHFIRSAPITHLVPEREPLSVPLNDVGEPPIPQTSAPTQHLVPPPDKSDD